MGEVSLESLSLGSYGSELEYFTIYQTCDSGKEDVGEVVYFKSNDDYQFKDTKSEASDSLDAQLRQIGLAQAMINLTRSFDESGKVLNVHSKKRRLTFFQPEPNITLLLSYYLGIRIRKTSLEQTVIDYLDLELSDKSVWNLLQKLYYQFKLGNGSLQANLNQPEVIKSYFDKVIFPKFSLEVKSYFPTMFQTVPQLVLNKTTYLNLSKHMDKLLNSFHQLGLAQLVLLVEDKLVWFNGKLPYYLVEYFLQLQNNENTKQKEATAIANKRNSFFDTLSNFNFLSSTSTFPRATTKPNNLSQLKFNLSKLRTNFHLKHPPNSSSTTDTNFKLQPCYIEATKYNLAVFDWSEKSTLLLLFHTEQAEQLEEKLEFELLTTLSTTPNLELFQDQKLNFELDLQNLNLNFYFFNSNTLALNFNLHDLEPELLITLIDLTRFVEKTQLDTQRNDSDGLPEEEKKGTLDILVRTQAEPKLTWVGVKQIDEKFIYFIIKNELNLNIVEDKINNLTNLYFTNMFLNT